MRRRLAAGLAALACAAGLSACGGPSEQAGEGATRGGTLTVLASADVDFLDPGRTYYTQGYMVAYATQRTLYRYRPDDATVPVPDLAAGPPEISKDARTVTVRLRKGVRFSPPVKREVVAADVKYAFERFFSVNVSGQYPVYFSALDGAPTTPTQGVRPIRGIETPDERTLVFHLRTPTAAGFVAALVMPITAPVPKDYARRFDAQNPSTYNAHVVATGPYMVRDYETGRRIELVRNPSWDRSTDDKPAYLDRVVIKVGSGDAALAARQVLDGRGMVLDGQPPASILRDVVMRRKDQFATVGSGAYRYITLTTTLPPFDNLDVRRAVLAGFSREAARKARGGAVTGELPTHFLPPGVPGFDEAGGFDGPGLDFLAKNRPGGDRAVAARYFRAAGYASGRYEGKDELLMLGASADPDRAVAEVAKAQFEALGFKVRLRLVPQDALATDWCMNPARRVAVCAGAAWFKDFADPQSMLEPTFKGAAINPAGPNTNMAQLDVPEIDKAMDDAALLSGPERLRAWGEIDRMITAQAPGIPYLWDETTLIRSRNVAGVANGYYSAWDFTATALKR